jgi:hypothetical protein
MLVIGASASYNCVAEGYTWTGTHNSAYILGMPSVTTSYDAGYRTDGTVWVANDASDSPVKAYNTSGVLVQYIPGGLIGNAARGVDFDANGYLWCSNPNTDKLYKISLSTGVGDQPEAAIPAGLSCSCNPFFASTVIEGAGFGMGARLEIFDLSGRMVVDTPFDGSFVLSGEGLPSGTYVARVYDGSTVADLRLVKL